MYGYQEGWGWWEQLGNWDWHIYTINTIYKVDTKREHYVQHKELYLMHCGSRNGKEVQKSTTGFPCEVHSRNEQNIVKQLYSNNN